MLNKATAFRFTHPVQQEISEESLDEALKKNPSNDCLPAQSSTVGWCPVLPDSDQMVSKIGDTLYFRLRICEKKIPPKALKSELEKRVRKLESNGADKIKSKEKNEIIDQIKLEFLPNTIQTEKTIVGAIDLVEGYLIVEEGQAMAESFSSFLRQTLGSLPAVVIGSEQSTHYIFSQLITEDLELANIELGDATTLQNSETKEKAVFSKADLHSDEVKAHVNSEMHPVKIKMHFANSSTAVITDKLTISSIKISDSVLDQQGINDIDDEGSLVRAEFFLWASSVVQMLQLLNPGLGLVPEKP